MRIATVVIAPQQIIDTAACWSRRGLVGDSLWVSSDGLAGVDPDTPNAIESTRLRFDHQPENGTLPVQLAALGTIDEARVLWLRMTNDTSQDVLQAMATQLSELLPWITSHWLDVVVPQRRTDETFAPLAGQWVQFRIHPSDRMAPDVTDAAWDRQVATPLHVTLALAGLLGGTFTELPWALLNAGQYHVVRVFSRLVDGGLEARCASTEFIATVLPETQAGLQHPATHLPANSQQGQQIVDRAAQWLMSQDDGALSYRPPERSCFKGHPRISLGQHLLQFWRFIPIGLRELFGLEPEPNAVVGHVLEFDDLGYSIGPEIPVIEWTSGIPDFAALEGQAAAEAKEILAKAKGKEGSSAPMLVWEPVARLSTALVDGNPALPAGWDLALITQQDRQLTLPTDMVLAGLEEPVDSAVPELAESPSPTIAAVALQTAGLAQPDSIAAENDPTGVTATAQRLAHQANEEDQARFAQQIKDLGQITPPDRPAALLEQIHGAVLGGLVRARLDAERWEQLATRSPTDQNPPWPKARARFRWLAGVILTTLSVLEMIWWNRHDQIATALGTSLGLAAGLAILAVALVLLEFVMLYLLFRVHSSYLERGRRRLELMALWLNRALSAIASHATQINTERVTRHWVRLLSDIPCQAPVPETPAVDAEPEQAPMAMRIGHPRFEQAAMDGWLAGCAAAPGWRLAALQSVLARVSGSPTSGIAWLAADTGLPGGRLTQLRADLPAQLTAWRESTADRVSRCVLAHMGSQADRLDVRRGPTPPSEQVAVTSFLQEITPQTDSQDDWPDDPRHSWVMDSELDPDANQLALVISPALCTGRVRVQVMDPDPADVPPQEDPVLDRDPLDRPVGRR